MITFVRHTCRCGARDWQFILRHHELIVALLAVIGLSGCTGSLATNTTGTNGSTGTLVASSTSVDFGSVAVGNTASMTVTLTNQGTTAVKISQMTVTGQSFKTSTQSSLPVTVAAGGTFTLTVGFSPTAMGAATGQLTVTGAAAVMTTTAVSLSGAGVHEQRDYGCGDRRLHINAECTGKQRRIVGESFKQ
jgi:hypothetical protein